MYRVLIDTDDGLVFDGGIYGPSLAEVRRNVAALDLAGSVRVLLIQNNLIFKVYTLNCAA